MRNGAYVVCGYKNKRNIRKVRLPDSLQKVKPVAAAVMQFEVEDNGVRVGVYNVLESACGIVGYSYKGEVVRIVVNRAYKAFAVVLIVFY